MPNDTIWTPAMVPLTGFPTSRSKLLDVVHRYAGRQVTRDGKIVGKIGSIRVGTEANARAEIRLHRGVQVDGCKMNMSCELVSG